MPDHPNIVLIVADDHGAWATGHSGRAAGLRTPTLDHLAITGARMERAYTPTPLCSPGRACLLTGLMPSQHGVRDNVSPRRPESAVCRLPAQSTLPEILQQAGYAGLFVGKWHLGGNAGPRAGFERWFSLAPLQGEHSGVQGYSDAGTLTEIAGFKTSLLTDRAVGFLRDHRGPEPFFLFLGYIGTHRPWAGHPERLVAPYRALPFADMPTTVPPPWAVPRIRPGGLEREWWAQYYAAVTHIDEGIGRILDTLEERGQRERTLVVYTADHGLCCGHHGIWGKGNGTEPTNMFEESLRVPLILNHPERLASGTVSRAVVDHCDSFRTLLDLADVPLPDAAGPARFPGRSYAPLLRGEPLEWKDQICGEYGPMRSIVTDRYKYVHRSQHPVSELYDLTEDPGETRNLAEEPGAAPLRAELHQRMAEWFQRYEPGAGDAAVTR